MDEPRTPYYRAIRLCDVFLVLKDKQDTLLDLAIFRNGEWLVPTDLSDEDMDKALGDMDPTQLYVTEIIPYYNEERGMVGIHIAASDTIEMHEYLIPMDPDLLEDNDE